MCRLLGHYNRRVLQGTRDLRTVAHPEIRAPLWLNHLLSAHINIMTHFRDPLQLVVVNAFIVFCLIESLSVLLRASVEPDLV